ncbi:MAG: four helix bundle protein [Candidatus Moranbacteria bacterium]|nr:four helix bundle protein [Candidatus Moranbacteria bacterium]
MKQEFDAGNKPKYDLEERTTDFAGRVIRLCKSLPRNSINEMSKCQRVVSTGSIGANYREANDSLGKKNFFHRLKVSRKEAKETLHWLELIQEANPEFEERMKVLIQESKKIKNILCSIIDKMQNRKEKV